MRQVAADDALLRFSFRFFDVTDAEICPANFRDGYTQMLMARLNNLSSWTVRRFNERFDRTIRNHKIEWVETSRPKGFVQLNEQFRAYPAWQFSLTANEHGRVHGLMIDDTFHVVWLDHNHILYP